MEDDSWKPTPFSREALHIFGVLARRSGTMRIGPLLQQSRMTPDNLAAAVNELAQRSWVKIEWRNPRRRMPPGLPERFREVERVTTTAFGRWRYPATWSTW